MKRCINCGHKVSQGDRHAKTQCPPKQTGRKYMLRRKARRKAKKEQDIVDVRGKEVAFIRQDGKIKGVKVLNAPQKKQK